MAQETSPTVKKKQGPIRFEAIIPFAIVVAAIWAYFFLLFDSNLKSALEFIGYNAVGAEVNVAKVQTSFWKADMSIAGIQVTNSENPSHNLFEVGEIRYGMSWDALLRGKILIEEASIVGIKIGTKRSHVGKVKPPEPPSNEPSALEKEADKLKRMAIEKAQKEYSDNVLGDIASILSGSSSGEQWAKIEGTLSSKQMAADIEKAFNEKQAAWDARFKTLPNNKDLNELNERLKNVKTKDFKTPQELQDSLKQVEAILKEFDEKIKVIKTAADDLNADVKKIESDVKGLEKQIKTDIKELESRFRIPKIDANTITKALFNHYFGPYMQKIEKYRAMAEKYIPPNIMKKVEGKDEPEEPEIQIQARERARGKSYEFGHANSYPLFWLKKAMISSTLGADKQSGNLTGSITDISSNQLLTRKPTVASLKGDFPSMEINGMVTNISIDNRKQKSEIAFGVDLASYPINSRELIKSKDVNIAFAKAQGQLSFTGKLVALKELELILKNDIRDLQYDIQSDNKVLKEILTNVFRDITNINLTANGRGTLPDVPIEFQSNVGGALQKGFEREIQGKIAEAKAKLDAYVNEQIGKQKAKLDADIAKFKTQYEAELSKVKAQVEAKQVEANQKITQAKKDAEDQAIAAKKQAEQELKKKAEQEVKKALENKDTKKKVDDLKKKLGL